MDKETALNTLAGWLGVPVSWIDSLIRFESSWNPAAKNKYTGARGLIQFMPATAKALGYKDADDLYNKNPTIEKQLLGPVAAYFKLPGNKGPYPTPQSLYMTVFYPAARSWTETKDFPANVRAVNPGIDTVGDYVAKVERRTLKKTGISVGVILLIAAGAYFAYNYLYKPQQGPKITSPDTETPQIYLGV
jgi:hypothetical protein